MRRRYAGCVLLAVGVVLLGGCASLPDSSTPQAIGTIEQQPVNQTVPAPTPGRPPELLLRDFFAASTVPADGHAAARQFMTTGAAARWDDTVSTSIVDKVDVLAESRSGDTASYTIRANRVGQLDPGGVYQAVEGSYEATIRLVRESGEWRIDELPPGVTLDRAQFLKTYQRKSLYFLDPTGSTTVPDLRWISSNPPDVADTLIRMLIAGPKPSLEGAVSNQLAGVRLQEPITKADGRSAGVGIGFGGLRIEFAGTGSLDPASRDRLAAQVVWTLANAEIPGPYVLIGDGKPLDERLPNGWTTADVSSTNPAPAPASVALHALRDGALVQVTDTGVAPLPGYFGAGPGLRSVALSRDGSSAAAVAAPARPAPEQPARPAPEQPTRPAPEQSAALMVGPVDGPAVTVLEGVTLTRPTWALGDSAVWTVVDGSRVVRVTRAGAGEFVTRPVDTSQISALGTNITEFRLSRDGVRAAAVIDGKVYAVTVVPKPDGSYLLSGAQPIAVGLGSPAVALDWSGSDSVVVARAASDIPVVTVAVDGSRMDALPSRNLTPPVAAVDATSATTYVADSRAVFRLNSADPARDRYWREVPGLTGVKAIPVVPG